VRYIFLCLVGFILVSSCKTFKLDDTSNVENRSSNISPDTLIFRQPDGNFISILGYGSMFESYQETIDGYTITTNKEGLYYIAKLNSRGDFVPSNIRAFDPEDRTNKINRKLKNYPKHLRYRGQKKKELDEKREKFNNELQDSKQIRENNKKN